MKFEWIVSNSSTFSVKGMCHALDVSTSGYHDWKTRPLSNRKQSDLELVDHIKSSQEESNGTYGSPRITGDLVAMGYNINEKRVARIMKEYGISAEKPRVFRVSTTDSNHDLPVAQNLLDRDFSVGCLNRVWVSDITYIQINGGFAYLTIVHDLGNREPVGWYLSQDMTAESVLEAFKLAVKKRRPDAGLIIHSDRGSQYASNLFREFISDYGFKQSMSRKGNCWDNAVAESFFHTLKTECLYRLEKIPSFKDLRQILFDYIELFYTRKRRHSSLGNLSPMEYAKKIA
jgi:transposase InsO family protein